MDEFPLSCAPSSVVTTRTRRLQFTSTRHGSVQAGRPDPLMRSEQMPQSSAFAACCVVQFTELSKNGGLGTATSVKARDRPVDRSNEVRCVAPSGEAGGRPRAFRRAGRCRLEAPKTGFGRDHEILRKEVIQPQVPLRLPCYDLVPIRGFTFGACSCERRRLRVPPPLVA